MTDSNGPIAGSNLRCFRIARELRGYRVNRIRLQIAVLVRANKQTLRVADVVVDTTRVDIVARCEGTLNRKPGSVDPSPTVK